MKMFPFCPRYPSNLPHVSSSYPLNKNLSSADHPRILQPPNNRQAQEDYVTGEQCIHILANMITHCLRNNYLKLFIHYILKTLLGRFPCGCNLYKYLNFFCYAQANGSTFVPANNPANIIHDGGWTLLSEFSSVVRADLSFDESIVVELK